MKIHQLSSLGPWRGFTAAPEDAPGDESHALYAGLDHIAALVVDGKGGISGGAEAARVVLDTAAEAFKGRVREIEQIGDLLVACDRKASEDSSAGEASGAVAVVARPRLLVASVGDTEAWVKERGRVERLSGRKQFGQGYEIGTGFLMFEVKIFSAAQVEWVVLLSDGAVPFLDEETLDAWASSGRGADALFESIHSRHKGFMMDTCSVVAAAFPGRP